METKQEKESHEISQIIIEYHELFEGILGYRRMTYWINKLNQKQYNQKRIRRLMHMMGIAAVIRKQKKGHQKSTPEVTAENVLNREFIATKPNEKWLTDVTEFKIKGKQTKLYLSAIIDLYDKSIVSYYMGTSNNNQLVFKTFDLAIKLNPNAKPMFHSDRGFQYTNKIFKNKLEHQGITQSMSRVGRCIDNGPMEGFWGTLKVEMYYLHQFHDIKELKSSIIKYIKFYNEQRFQAKLKGLTPIEHRNQALSQLNI